MKMEKVFRIQDREGRGPWKPGFSHKWVVNRPDHKNLISWYEEFGPVHESIPSFYHIGTACTSLKQLRRWFTRREYKALLGFGYSAVCMHVDEIIKRSDIQCLVVSKRPLIESVMMAVRLY
jgi:hypothetical protein